VQWSLMEASSCVPSESWYRQWLRPSLALCPALGWAGHPGALPLCILAAGESSSDRMDQLVPSGWIDRNIFPPEGCWKTCRAEGG
jgi:hypothetical protein